MAVAMNEDLNLWVRRREFAANDTVKYVDG